MAENSSTTTTAPSKRVIVFASQLLPSSETFIREQVRAMQQWQPILVGERRAMNGLSLDGVDFRLLCPPEEGRFRRWAYVLCRLLHLPHPPSVRRLQALNASLIHAHFGTAAVDIWPLARALRLPMLVSLHGFDINIYPEWWESGKGGWRRRRYPRQLLQLAQESKVDFIAVSEAIRKRAIEYGIPANKISVRYIGVDTGKFSLAGPAVSEREKRVLFVGRLVENKGVEYLIRAFVLVRKVIPNAELIIGGDGPQREQLTQLTESLNLPVRFLGALTTNEVKNQLGKARVFCLPSVTISNGASEGFGMVLLEAQASGLPVVTSAKGGAVEGIRDGETGYSFAEGDVQDLSEKLTALLTDDRLVDRFSWNAIVFVRRNFEIISLSRLLEKTYDTLAQ